MAAFDTYSSYAIQEHAGYDYGSIRKPRHHAQDRFLSTIDPSLRDTTNEYALFQQELPNADYNTFPLLSSQTHAIQMTSPASTNQFFQYDQHSYTNFYDHSRLSPYSSPVAPSGSNLSDESSEYAWSADMGRMAPPMGNSQAESFNFAPLPTDSQMSHHSGWSTDSSFLSPLTPLSELEPRMHSVAMKELEFKSPRDATFDQQFLEDKMSSVHLQFPFQPTPEELDISDDITPRAVLYHSGMMPTHTIEASEEDSTSSGHSPRSDSGLSAGYKTSSGAQLTSRHVQHLTHGRNGSTAGARSSRGPPPTHPILDSQSRVNKGRQPKGLSQSQPITKERVRSKGINLKSAAVEQSRRGDKQVKSYPCAFHLFGCRAIFGNKNEWKRHVNSQHLQLFFYRCDMGQCNPENNPKLYVPPENSRPHSIKQDPEHYYDEEDKDIIFNDFNRKDLFTQHCRRMHGPQRHSTDHTTLTNQRINARVQKQQASRAQGGSHKSKSKSNVTKDDEAAFENELEDIRSRCRMLRRKAPARTSCGFCGQLFQVESDNESCSPGLRFGEEGKAEEKVWEERMEHIGKHYERDGCSPRLENIDDDLVEWGLSVGILEHIVDSAGVTRPWLVGNESRGQRNPVAAMEGDEVRITGIRPQSEQNRSGLRSKKESVRSHGYSDAMTDSEDDASAEDE